MCCVASKGTCAPKHLAHQLYSRTCILFYICNLPLWYTSVDSHNAFMSSSRVGSFSSCMSLFNLRGKFIFHSVIFPSLTLWKKTEYCVASLCIALISYIVRESAYYITTIFVRVKILYTWNYRCFSFSQNTSRFTPMIWDIMNTFLYEARKSGILYAWASNVIGSSWSIGRGGYIVLETSRYAFRGCIESVVSQT